MHCAISVFNLFDWLFEWAPAEYVFSTTQNNQHTHTHSLIRCARNRFNWIKYCFFLQNEMAEHWRIARLQNWKMRFNKLAKFGPIRLQGLFDSLLIICYPFRQTHSLCLNYVFMFWINFKMNERKKILIKIACAIRNWHFCFCLRFSFRKSNTHRLFFDIHSWLGHTQLKCITNSVDTQNGFAGEYRNQIMRRSWEVNRRITIDILNCMCRTSQHMIITFFCNIECQKMRMPQVGDCLCSKMRKGKMAAICVKRQPIRHCDWWRRRVCVEHKILFIFIRFLSQTKIWSQDGTQSNG